jgi:phosphopantetheine adenylyltransferase
MNNTNYIREAMYRRMGIEDKPKREASEVSAEIAGMTHSLEDVVKLARPRLIMGGIRYGSDWKHEPLMEYMQKKFDTYKETGNFEMLVDLVNFVAIEGKLKTHPRFHFNALDRKE